MERRSDSAPTLERWRSDCAPAKKFEVVELIKMEGLPMHTDSIHLSVYNYNFKANLSDLQGHESEVVA